MTIYRVMDHEEEELGTLGTIIKGVEDDEEVNRTEELSAVDDEWTKVIKRSESGRVDFIRFRPEKGRRLKYRSTPLAEMTMRNMERDGMIGFKPTYCMECGIEIEAGEYTWFDGNAHYCNNCGYELYAEQPEAQDELVCTRCGEDIDNADDIYGFEKMDTSEEACMCSRCSAIKHRFPLWENFLKET